MYLQDRGSTLNMKIQNNACLRCGALQFTEYCEFCEPNMVWAYDDFEVPPKDPPSDQELEDMAEYFQPDPENY